MSDDECVDFISFIDPDDETRKDWNVKIKEVGGQFVTFVTISGNTISIPSNRVLKIKRKEAASDGKR